MTTVHLMIPTDFIETLLEKPYHIIDLLPKRVPADSKGQYFQVEAYFLARMDTISRKFAETMIRLICYEEMQFSADGDAWSRNPDPEAVIRFFEDTVKGHDPLYILFSNALITFNGDEHFMTLYNADPELVALIRLLAGAEGLFVWKPEE